MSQHLPVRLTPEERSQLLQYTRRGKHHSRVIARAQMLLFADRNQPKHKTQSEIAQLLDCSKDRVVRICRSFTLNGLHDALHDRPRTGAPPKITGDLEAKLVLLACSEPPEGRQRWTLRLLAEQMVTLGYVDALSNVAVYKRLKKTSLNRGR